MIKKSVPVLAVVLICIAGVFYFSHETTEKSIARHISLIAPETEGVLGEGTRLYQEMSGTDKEKIAELIRCYGVTRNTQGKAIIIRALQSCVQAKPQLAESVYPFFLRTFKLESDGTVRGQILIAFREIKSDLPDEVIDLSRNVALDEREHKFNRMDALMILNESNLSVEEKVKVFATVQNSQDKSVARSAKNRLEKLLASQQGK